MDIDSELANSLQKKVLKKKIYGNQKEKSFYITANVTNILYYSTNIL